MIKKCKNLNSSFSLIEIIVVLFLIALISGLMVVILKPGTFFQRARDAKRVSDLSKIEKFFEAKKFSDLSFSENKFLDPKIVYISLPDSSSTCGSWLSDLPSLSSPYSYRCSATPTNIDGTGWIPLDFQGITSENFLPIDPINKPPYYYTFVVGGSYELEAKMENNFQISFNDGGDSGFFYEKGSNLKLTPFQARGGLRFTREEEEKFLNNVCPTCFQGLVGYWTFDEGNGTTTKDLSGYGNDGTLYSGTTSICSNPPTSGCPTWVTGKIGSALSLDGSNDYVDCNPIPALPAGSTERTITALIRVNQLNRNVRLSHIFHYGYASYNQAFGLAMYSADSKFGAHEWSLYTRYGDVPLNQWVFLAITLSGNKVKKYYQNGSLIAVHTTDPAPNTVLNSCKIGTRVTPYEYFNGLIDEVRIYNRALSDSEIKALYQAAN